MALWAGLALWAAPVAARAGGPTLVPGDSISDAVNYAACGDTVTLSAGTYDEDVEVYDITLCPPDQRIRVVGAAGPRPLIVGRRSAIRYHGSGVDFEHLELTTRSARCDIDHRVVLGDGTYFDFIDVYIHDGGYDGFGTYCGAANIRLLDSEVARNGLGCFDGGPLNGDGADLFACRDCEVGNSWIHGNNLYAIQIKGGTSGIWVHDSTLASQSQYVIIVGRPGNTDDCPGLAYNAEDVLIERNVLVATWVNGWPLEVYDVSGLVFQHNTIVIHDNEAGADGLSGGFVSFSEDLTADMSVIVRNNIFDSRGPALIFPFCLGGAEKAGCTEPWALAGLEAGNNLFHDTSGALTAPPDGAATSLVADPLFVAWPGDLGLDPSSPAVDAGQDVGAPFTGAAPDLGAFELGDDGTQPPDPMDPLPGSAGHVNACGCATVGRRGAGAAGPLALVVILAACLGRPRWSRSSRMP